MIEIKNGVELVKREEQTILIPSPDNIAGKMIGIWPRVQPLELGEYTLEITIDSKDGVDESSELNNVFTKSFTVVTASTPPTTCPTVPCSAEYPSLSSELMECSTDQQSSCSKKMKLCTRTFSVSESSTGQVIRSVTSERNPLASFFSWLFSDDT